MEMREKASHNCYDEGQKIHKTKFSTHKNAY